VKRWRLEGVTAAVVGSEVQDEIFYEKAAAIPGHTNRAGEWKAGSPTVKM